MSGVAVFASKSALALKAMGHQVIVLAPSAKGNPYREIQDGILVHRIRSIPSPFRRKFRLVAAQNMAINKILRAFKPDIIHVQDVGGSSSAGVKWGKRNQIPVVGTRHSSAHFGTAYIPFGKFIPEEMLHTWVDSYAHEFFEDCTVITTPTETVRQLLIESGYEGPVEVLSNGVDIPELPNLKRREENTVPIVLCVSRMSPEKNISLLLKAAPLVNAKRPVQFIVVGDGNKLMNYRKQVEEKGMSNYVRFVGALKQHSVAWRGWYEKANLAVTPCLIETQSITTMEAMAYALPVVAPESGALPELIIPNKTGYLVAIPNPENFAESICRGLDNRKEAVQLGVQARQFVEQYHSREKTVDDLLTIYKKAIAGDYSSTHS
jgi:glycosyltransferase involved in cell wall biosynthesis